MRQSLNLFGIRVVLYASLLYHWPLDAQQDLGFHYWEQICSPKRMDTCGILNQINYSWELGENSFVNGVHPMGWTQYIAWFLKY